MITATHDAATCRLCEVLQSGESHTRNGVEITPFCATCDGHHPEKWVCKTVGLKKGDCPRCRVARCEVEDIPESGRWEHKKYAPYCLACLEAEGYVRVEHTVGLREGPYIAVWWQKRGAVREQDTGDPFRGFVEVKS